MLFRNVFTGCVVVMAAMATASGQKARRGVDLVTNLSNGIIPTLFKALSRPDNENLVMGPFGLLSNLAMILEASDGKTRHEILRSLKISKDHIQHLRNGFQAYCELFVEHASEQEAAGSFNSALVSNSLELDKTYKSLITKTYCANVSESQLVTENTMEFRSDAGVMSHWRDYDKLAVYTFLSHQSVLPFKKWNNETTMVPMIPQVGLFKNARWEKSQIILIPLKASFVHLLLVIPDEANLFDGLVNKLVKNNLPNLIQSMAKEEMEVFIPQLTAVNKNANLSEILIKSGIKQLFDSKKANLTKASGSPAQLYVKDITQNSYFSTSFVALSSVSGANTSFGARRRKRDTKKFYIDKPFIFFLLHKDTHLALLVGKIGNPVQVPT